MPDEDFHLADHARSQAHEGGALSPPRVAVKVQVAAR